MSSPEERATLRELIGEATTAGARQARACAVVNGGQKATPDGGVNQKR
jgi:hypothetical protein